jgi:hypothetical protein
MVSVNLIPPSNSHPNLSTAGIHSYLVRKSCLLDSMLAEIAEMGSSSTIKLFSNMFLHEESAILFQ